MNRSEKTRRRQPLSDELRCNASAALLVAVPAFAQTVEEPFVSTGQVTVGGIATDTSGKDLSKFMEYQDLSNGVLSNIGRRTAQAVS